MHVSSPPLLAYLSDKIVVAAELTKSVLRIAIFEFSRKVLAFFLACASDEPCARCTSSSRIRARDAHGVFFSLPPRVLRVVNDKSFYRLLRDFSFELVHTLLVFRHSQKVDWSHSSRLRWLSYAFAKVVVAAIKPFTVIGQKGGVDGEEVSLEAH